jgi:serine phosphatase RsbU (regulator of sigma subunit)
MEAGLMSRSSIRTLLVDDEELARVRMRDLLKEVQGVEIVGEARDGEEALTEIRNLRPDLVFLDIQMPGKSGIEVAAALEPPRPRVIYCTAFDQYAVSAFELNAVDYLLKPVTKGRLGKTMERVRAQISERSDFLEEVERAEAVQASLFPRRLPRLETLEYTGLCRPVQHVSGDYYDFLPFGDGRLGIAVGDVSGKGMSAGLLMAGLQGRLQSQAAHHGIDLEGLLASLNMAICEATDAGRFVTFFYAVYEDDSRRMHYVNAGHNPPLLLRRRENGGGIERLERGGIVLGVVPGSVYEMGAVEINPGDLFVVFTDGLTEMTNPAGREFGEERLIAALRRSRDLPLDDLAGALLHESRAFGDGKNPEDDMTLVLARGR